MMFYHYILVDLLCGSVMRKKQSRIIEVIYFFCKTFSAYARGKNRTSLLELPSCYLGSFGLSNVWMLILVFDIDPSGFNSEAANAPG